MDSACILVVLPLINYKNVIFLLIAERYVALPIILLQKYSQRKVTVTRSTPGHLAV